MSIDRKHEPRPSSDKAPYGHAEEAPLAAQLPEDAPAPEIELLEDRLRKLAEQDQLMASEADSLGRVCQNWTDVLTEIVRSKPLTAVLATFAVAALITRLAR
jgi:hypothetical protein